MNNRTIKWLAVAVVLACVVGALAIAAFEMTRERPEATADARRPAADGEKGGAKPPAEAGRSADSRLSDAHLIDDDGQTLWASPTSGPPIDLAYLPPGCQIIIAARPSQMHIRDFDALGPYRQDAERVLRLHVVSVPRDLWVDKILIGLQLASDGNWLITRVRRYPKPFENEVVRRYASETFDVHGTHKGESYGLDEGRAFYITNVGNMGVLAVGPEEPIKEIIDLAGNAPPLRRDMERLLTATDADRDVTILFAPNFLFGEGQGMFNGQWAALREPLFWFLGDEFSAGALSLDWGENFFIEFTAIPTVDTRPEVAARQLAERVAAMPDRIEEFVLGLDPQPYGRRVIARFPAMVRALARYTRTDVENGRVVLRCYLPAAAGQNLILGAELTLAEAMSGARREGEGGGGGSSGGDGSDGRSPVAKATSPSTPLKDSQTVAERLRRATSLAIARDSLEAALEQLAQDIGVEIVLVGPDLQADGITRNQMVALELEDRPAEEILVEILRLANPDKSASGPADVRQKLVYVVKAGGDGEEAVFITTRGRAAERGEQLPVVFVVP